MHDRTVVQIFRDRRGIESRRHDNDSEFGPRTLQSLQQCQSEIAIQMALMKFVENNGGHALQIGIGKQSPGEYALSNKSQPSTRANRFFKPDLISNGLADLLAKFRCDSARGQSCCDAARFKHNHVAAHSF